MAFLVKILNGGARLCVRNVNLQKTLLAVIVCVENAMAELELATTKNVKSLRRNKRL